MLQRKFNRDCGVAKTSDWYANCRVLRTPLHASKSTAVVHIHISNFFACGIEMTNIHNPTCRVLSSHTRPNHDFWTRITWLFFVRLSALEPFVMSPRTCVSTSADDPCPTDLQSKAQSASYLAVGMIASSTRRLITPCPSSRVKSDGTPFTVRIAWPNCRRWTSLQYGLRDDSTAWLCSGIAAPVL